MIKSVFVAKEVQDKIDDEYKDHFTRIISSEKYEIKTVFFDTSLSKENESSDDVVCVDYEDRTDLNSIIINKARDLGFDILISFNHFSYPKTNIIESLCKDMDDDNIFATYSDYSTNGTPMIQSIPIVVCRRIDDDNYKYDLNNCSGIVKYIPMDLYDVYT